MDHLEQIRDMNAEIHRETKNKVREVKDKYLLPIYEYATTIDKVKKIIQDKCEIIRIPIYDNKLGGFIIEKDKSFYCLVNTHQPRGFQNFVLCHEFYHLLYPEDSHHAESITTQTDLSVESLERKANYFSAMIQMEEFRVREEFDYLLERYDTDYLRIICELMTIFQTTFRAIVIRLYELDLLTDGLAKKYFNYKGDIKTDFEYFGLDLAILEPSLQLKIGNLDYEMNKAEKYGTVLGGTIRRNKEYVNKRIQVLRKLYEEQL